MNTASTMESLVKTRMFDRMKEMVLVLLGAEANRKPQSLLSKGESQRYWKKLQNVFEK